MSLRPLALLARFAFPLVLALVACTPSPEKTCQKLKELGDKDTKYVVENGAPFQLDMSKCLANMNEMKQRDPEAYKCAAKTIDKLDDLDTAFLAISVCDSNNPKNKQDNDDKKKGDDDDKGKKKSSKDD
jgi:hypothetical protein